MIINIIGGGPRGLSIALYALHKGYKINLIDPSPIHTWSTGNIISDIEMRSPITFDLFTYIEEMKDFTLAKYLGIDIPFTTNQSIIESNSIKVTRPQFCNYLNFIYNIISTNSNTTVINKEAIDVIDNSVVLKDGTKINGDAVVFCIGFKGVDKNPHWLKDNKINSKNITLYKVLSSPNNYINKSWLVIGSGQGSAEIVNYLITNIKGNVTWSVNKSPIVYQYPSPDHMLWGTRSALGDYYSKLTNIQTKLDYLSKVKQWQPSITPYINNQLQLVKDKYNIINIKDYTQLSSLVYDYTIISNGLKPSIKSLPVNSIIIPGDKYISNFPDISSSFRLNLGSVNNKCNWYVSGLLATAYDGPRQASLISAGLTSKQIIDNL